MQTDIQSQGFTLTDTLRDYVTAERAGRALARCIARGRRFAPRLPQQPDRVAHGAAPAAAGEPTTLVH